MDIKRDNVVVTGFGLFREHKLNPSWEAIRDGRLRIDLPNVNIITKQVDVIYEQVDRVVDQLWTEYKPILMVHVGLSALESRMRIEQYARHGPYLMDDLAKNAPHKQLRQYAEDDQGEETTKRFTCKPCNFDTNKTCFNVDRICDKLNEMHAQGEIAIPFKTSQDAGLYVCEYIYHKSLSICDKVVFIHVPDVEKFKLEDITRSLEIAIKLLIEELNSIE